MNLITLQDRIINLDNVTCIKKYRPGDRHPDPLIRNFRFAKFIIQVELNVPWGSAEGFDPAIELFEYSDECAWAQEWHRLCDLATFQ